MTAPKLGALAVVLRDGNALLVQRGKDPNRGVWGFPGGHVELGETALVAAERELAEETGVVATAQGYLTCVDVIGRDAAGGVTHHYLLAAVQCTYVSGTPVAADDAADARWVSFDDIRAGRLEMSDRVETVLDAALAQAQIT